MAIEGAQPEKPSAAPRRERDTTYLLLLVGVVGSESLG